LQSNWDVAAGRCTGISADSPPEEQITERAGFQVAAAAGPGPESDASTTPGGGTADHQNLDTGPAMAFSVNYAADMLLMVVIGGIGTM
jgi:hypothetical protein